MRWVHLLMVAMTLCLGCSVLPINRALPTSAPLMDSQAEEDLGTRPADFGSQGQARALLALIVREPKQRTYVLYYRTADDTVMLTYDATADTLKRVHRMPGNGGHGTLEQWNGSIEDRLLAAADGESLNKTPSGVRPGTYSRY